MKGRAWALTSGRCLDDLLFLWEDVYMGNNLAYQHDAQHVHLIVYHLIWCPKRRRKVLVNQIGKRCEELIREQCTEHGWTILELAVQPDHIHLFVRAWPEVRAAEIVKECKGYSAFILRTEFPELHTLPSIWTRSYYASTAGAVSGETIARSVAAQSTK
jgi:putative transposase